LTENLFKRIFAKSNLNPNPTAQKLFRENEMTSFFGKMSRYHRPLQVGVSSVEDVRTFSCKKLQIFRNLWCVRKEQRTEASGHFTNKKEERVDYLRFCKNVFYRRSRIAYI